MKSSVLGSLAAMFIAAVACGSTLAVATPQAAAIPAPAAWLDCGAILTAGAEGEWDAILWGGFANSLVKQGDTYFLYYQGSRTYDDAAGTVTGRSIGVATSQDGIHFTKYAHNPILTWSPNHEIEEGAVSGGAFLDANGQIAIYYGANTFAGGDQVRADGRLAGSADGLHFTDQGIVLAHTDSTVWGAGDELFPIIGLQDDGRWVAYYIPNGSPQRGQLGVAWGSARSSLTNSAPAQSSGSPIAVWGSGGYGRLGPGEYALFLSNLRATDGFRLEARTMALANPANLSAPVQRYDFADVAHASVMLDGETATWLMAYGNATHDGYGIKLAAADGRPISCVAPNTPAPTDTPAPTNTPAPTSIGTPATPLPSIPPRLYLPFLDANRTGGATAPGGST